MKKKRLDEPAWMLGQGFCRRVMCCLLRKGLERVCKVSEPSLLGPWLFCPVFISVRPIADNCLVPWVFFSQALTFDPLNIIREQLVPEVMPRLRLDCHILGFWFSSTRRVAGLLISTNYRWGYLRQCIRWSDFMVSSRKGSCKHTTKMAY